jgi:hypothetical protein
MAADTATSPTKAALEEAVLDLTDEQLVKGLTKVDPLVARAFRDREADTWPREATRNLLEALARRLERGRVPAKS